ncbi:LOW QUALITY PROTEIN: hypothetical protein PHMEG_00020135 [Phytophthora megakarya]|uniref:Uncharacterized protein n=1 Tax=Phytophthora megakarya TaxID=4795 RepID=A0A225VRE0_9STRA|nr:LOW QUALITY PROTEIN: hypothetical protein PHMEG_00020135 [Phytophthora megakarya]
MSLNNASNCSDDGSSNKHKDVKISSSGTPVRWDGEVCTFNIHAVVNAFKQSLLDGREKEDPTWSEEWKGEFKRKQAKIKILIQGSLGKRLAKQVMSKATGTEIWEELATIYEGKSNPAQRTQKCELHSTHLKGKDDVRSHPYKLFDLKDRLAEPVDAFQMVDKMLCSLPGTLCYNELRRNQGRDYNAFGKKTQARKTPTKPVSGNKSDQKKSNPNNDSKPKTVRTDIECIKCGGYHLKSDYPELVGKPSVRKNLQAKYARSGEKNAEQEAQKQDPLADDSHKKRDVVVGEVAKIVSKDNDPDR